MNCDHTREAFSKAFDLELAGDELIAFERHVASCEECQTEWRSYQASIRTLRNQPLKETSPELRHSILAAIDADQGESAAPPPVLVPAGGRFRRDVLTVLLGAAAATLLWWALSFAQQPRVVTETVAVEVPVEVPVEIVREVEVVREVPVQVVREVPVEVVREVLREVPVETIVERGPLLAIDTAPLARGIERLFDRVENGSVQLLANAITARMADTRPGGRGIAAPRTPTRPSFPPDDANLAANPLLAGVSDGDEEPARIRWIRSGGRIEIVTSGPVDKVVPMLIGQLDSANRDVRQAIENRLAAIHSEASRDSRIANQLTNLPDGSPEVIERSGSFFETGRRRDLVRERSKGEEWTDWWNENRTLLALASAED
ncbi:MAG: zf-HC2 domain-containing protein [Planctomycetota bacterium]